MKKSQANNVILAWDNRLLSIYRELRGPECVGRDDCTADPGLLSMIILVRFSLVSHGADSPSYLCSTVSHTADLSCRLRS